MRTADARSRCPTTRADCSNPGPPWSLSPAWAARTLSASRPAERLAWSSFPASERCSAARARRPVLPAAVACSWAREPARRRRTRKRAPPPRSRSVARIEGSMHRSGARWIAAWDLLLLLAFGVVRAQVLVLRLRALRECFLVLVLVSLEEVARVRLGVFLAGVRLGSVLRDFVARGEREG